MGDEHWCSLCNERLTKGDGYLELNWHKDKTHLRGICCTKCMKSEAPFADLWRDILKLPNPTFFANVTCLVTSECPDFKPTNSATGNCEYLTYCDNVIYCRRLHPGYTTIPRGRVKDILFSYSPIRLRRAVYSRLGPRARSNAEEAAKGREEALEERKEIVESLPK